MNGLLDTAARLAAALACATLVATPLAAAPAVKSVPVTVPLSFKPLAAAQWSPADESFDQHRRWRRHRGDGIDGGDLLGGLLVLGGIAAVAAAIDKSKDERRERTGGYDYPYEDRRYPDRPYDYRDRDRDGRDGRWGGGERGQAAEQDRAVEACTAEAARSGRVDEIYEVERVDGEWRVRGDFENGRAFTCTVDSSGRAFVGVGARSEAGRGWDARGRGDDFADRADEDDGRYATAEAPDFEDSRAR